MKAEFYEAVLNLAAHPLLWGMSRLARRVGPVWTVPGLGTLVSDAAIAREILKRDQDFTKNGPGSFAGTLTAALGPMALGNMDGEAHRKLRTAIACVLTPERSEVLVRQRAASLETLCGRLVQGESVDIAEFVRGWSGRIAFDLVGIEPPAGHEQEACQEIVRLSGRMAAVLGFRQPSGRKARKVLGDCDRLSSFFSDGYEHPASPATLAGQLQKLGLTFEQARGLLLIFVIGGTLTISAALPRIVALLLDHGLFTRMANDPAIIPRVIDEGLRIVAPLPGTVRIAGRDTTVSDLKIARGSRLVVLTCNLARDRRVFPRPDRFDLTRDYDPRIGRLWYGAGPHRCAGFNLAQSELKAILGALAGMGRDLRIVKRRTALGALLPAYSRLVVRTSQGRG